MTFQESVLAAGAGVESFVQQELAHGHHKTAFWTVLLLLALPFGVLLCLRSVWLRLRTVRASDPAAARRPAAVSSTSEVELHAADASASDDDDDARVPTLLAGSRYRSEDLLAYHTRASRSPWNCLGVG